MIESEPPFCGYIQKNLPSALAHPGQANDPRRRMHGLSAAYPDYIRAIGLLPMAIPPNASRREIAAYLSNAQGLVLGGGGDFSTEISGAVNGEISQEVRHVMSEDPERDDAELEALIQADRLGLPVLGICRGGQAINLHRGGTLRNIDHLMWEPDAAVFLDPKDPFGNTLSIQLASNHPVAVKIADAVGSQNVHGVIHAHHQALDKVGDGLIVHARGPHGIPAIWSDPEARMLGLQGHIEHPLLHPLGAAAVIYAEHHRDLGNYSLLAQVIGKHFAEKVLTY